LHGHFHIVKSLLDATEYIDSDIIKHALLLCVENNHFDLLDILLTYNFNFKEIYEYILQWSIDNNHIQAVEYFTNTYHSSTSKYDRFLNKSNNLYNT
jgi:hypothetical protein